MRAGVQGREGGERKGVDGARGRGWGWDDDGEGTGKGSDGLSACIINFRHSYVTHLDLETDTPIHTSRVI